MQDLEDRRVPSTFSVLNTLGTSSAGSLRWAIDQANSHQGADTIIFDGVIFGTPQTISLSGAQLALTDTTGATSIIGPPAGVTVHGGGLSRAFEVDALVTASFLGLTITGGTANAERNGGGLLNAGTLTLTNCTITGNSAYRGGGLYNIGTATLANCTMSSNAAAFPGGGLFNLGTAMLSHCNFYGNHADGYFGIGGGVCNSGTVVLTNCMFSGNTAGFLGGGLFNTGTATLTYCEIRGNNAGGTPNTAAAGGGVYNNSGTVELIYCVVIGNTAAEDGGGIGNSGTLIAAFTTIRDNQTVLNLPTFIGGGGLYNNGGSVALTNCAVTGNVSGMAGGGLWNLRGGMTLSQCAITGNSAGVSGGGLATGSPSSDGASTSLTHCTISDNIAMDDGGGMFNGGMATLTNCTASGNTTTAGYGGGLYNAGTVTLTNCTLVGNDATLGGGGLSNSVTATLNNCTISGNNVHTAGNGGGVRNSGTMLNATNTIVAGNQASIGADIYGSLSTNLNNLISMSAAAAGLGTLGNFGGPTHTVLLLPGSPAINAGSSVGAPSTDQRDLPRFGVVDIGAFEVQAAPFVVSTRVNDGSFQRSRVSSLTVTLNYVVSFAGSVASAFTLLRTGGGSVNFRASASVLGGVTVVTVDNFTGAETQFGSLSDGRFTLTALASQIGANGQSLDGNADGVGGDNYTFGDAQGLFRFYGDMNGDRRIDIADFGFFSLAFLNPANYSAALDFNSDGRIDIADFGQFSARFFTSLP